MSASAADPPAAGAAPEPLALVRGEPFNELPRDLYIPPDALEVFLDSFEGPLDLLLYLIRKQNLNILDIPIAAVTRQYMEYLALMETLRFELAAEYLLMAAWLAEIKSRLLLPRSASDDDDDDLDPRAELVKRLQEYERFKLAAEQFDQLPRLERDVFAAAASLPPAERIDVEPPPVSLEQLLAALQDVLARSELYGRHQVQRERLSTRERMTRVLDRLSAEPDQFSAFVTLFEPTEGRLGVVVTLLAVLELIREALLELVQAQPYAPIYVRLKSPTDELS